MKKRNLFLSLLFIGACAFVGLGYATITRELKIGGQLAGAKDDTNLNVSFVDGEFAVVITPNASTTIVATPTKTNDHTANVDVSGMSDIGDKVEAYFLVKNNSQPSTHLDATLATPNVIVNNGSQTATDHDDAANIFVGEHFEITAEYVESTGTGKADGTGEIDSTNITASLAAPVEDPATEGETVWVKVSVELIDVIIADTFPTHNITVSFTASTASA